MVEFCNFNHNDLQPHHTVLREENYHVITVARQCVCNAFNFCLKIHTELLKVLEF